MAFQPCPDIVTTTIQGRMDNQLVILDQAWFASGPISLPGMAALAGGLAAWVIGSLAPLLSRDVSFNRIVAVDQSTATGFTVEVAAVADGGVDVEAAPNNVAACVSLRTDQRGRSARGRNFVPGIPNSVITLNTLDSAFIGDLIDAYLEIIGAGTFVVGWEMVVLSRVSGGTPRANGIGIPITNVTMVGSSVRSMRSREIGHGS